MINKIKDFFKSKLSRRRDENLSSQDEDGSGEFYIEGDDQLPKPSLKERFQTRLSNLDLTLTRFKNTKLPKTKLKVSLPKNLSLKSGAAPTLLSPNLSRAIDRVVGRSARETIHQISLVAITCAVTYSLGKITALALKGNPHLDSPKDYTVSISLENDFNPATLAQVKSINIFRTNTGLGGKKKVADAKCETAEQNSGLPIKLLNTVVLQDSVKSLASVQIRGDRNLQEVREGEQISNLAKIFKITRLEILVKNLENGVCESIVSDKAKFAKNSPFSVMSPAQSKEYKLNKKLPGIENDGNKFKISKKILDDKLKDIGQILTQVRAIKIQNPDGTLAFKLTEMDPQGLFPYLGLQDGDIITSIDGKPIYDMNEVMSKFGRIKNLSQLQLGIKREGSDSLLDYNIK